VFDFDAASGKKLWSLAAAWLDFDNDGHEDLLVYREHNLTGEELSPKALEPCTRDDLSRLQVWLKGLSRFTLSPLRRGFFWPKRIWLKANTSQLTGSFERLFELSRRM
jgi:hypothetical protein